MDLGRRCSSAMAQTCSALRPGMTEFDVAGRCAGEMLALGVTPTLILVAADERAAKYRHPICTAKVASRSLLIAISGRSSGLILSMSRIVAFGEIDSDLRRRHDAVVRVDAALILSSRPGKAGGEILQKAIDTYAAVGFPNEWRKHHQGGPTGCTGRDFKAEPGGARRLVENQAIAWNPSIAGTKSEDTIIARSTGPLVLWQDASWPQTTIEFDGEKIVRPDILCI